MTQTLENVDADLDLADQSDLADALLEMSKQFQDVQTTVP